MPRWVVEYWGRAGRSRVSVRAGSYAMVPRLSNVPTGRVIRITRDRSLPELPELFTRKPSGNVQLLFLVRACAMYASSGRVAVDDLINEFGELRRIAKTEQQVWREDLDLSRRLQYLRFDSVVTVLIVTGERTGTLEQSLRAAMRYIKTREAVRNNTSSQVSMGVLLFALGMLALLSLPLILSEPLRGLQNIRGIEIKMTWATDILFGLNFLLGEQLLFTLTATGAATVLVAVFRKRLAWIGSFGLTTKLRNTKRSVRLLMTWVPFRLMGLALESEENLLTDVLGKDAAAALIPRLRSGAALGDVLDQRWFSGTLARSGSGLGVATSSDVQPMADAVMSALLEEMKSLTGRVAMLLYLGGVAATISVIAIVAFGLIFPIIGATVNVL